jgi:pimeloyl-ACP methyl ester carboxylesterase
MNASLKVFRLVRIAAFTILAGVGASGCTSAEDAREASSPIADSVRTVEVNGVELAYVERGEGEPVVLIHGFLHDYRVWSMQVPALSKDFRVISYSMRHRWPHSPEGDASDVSPTADVTDLVALIRELELSPAHLVGHSAGAGAALRVARDHPELVRSIVLAEPGPFAFTVDPAAEGPPSPPEWIGAVREAYEAGETEKALELIKGAVLGDEGPAQPLPPWSMEMALDNSWQIERMWAPSRDAPAPPVTCDEARRIQAPTLLMGGEHSPAFFGPLLDGLLKCLPFADRAELANSSHGLELENPSGFNEIVLPFLARHAAHAGR